MRAQRRFAVSIGAIAAWGALIDYLCFCGSEKDIDRAVFLAKISNVTDLAKGTLFMSTLSRFIRRVVWSPRVFEFWQRLGVNVTRKHFYSPIPDTREIRKRKDFFTRRSAMPGVDIRDQAQLEMLEKVFSVYKPEMTFPVERTDCPYEYYLNNSMFGIQDACVLHSMVRHFKPQRMIEVGSGNSTYVTVRAGKLNHAEGHPLHLTSVEPYPKPILKTGFKGLDELIIKKAEDVDMSLFEQLGENDIFFIDSSHIVRPGSDVNYLFLEILPRLKPGVVVHVHDIFLPYEYPPRFVLDNVTFMSEQYLMQAFLCHNESFEVLFANYYMKTTHTDECNRFFAPPAGYRDRCLPTSFWMRKTK
ncbi:MAG: class I SAM-dependent methyltransferase [Sedimentisphaerales bacterium]|nr:class I SAM-dependent methyltransferase [Sedimentisphaerales bacterium]